MGDLDVARGNHDIYLAFGANPSEAQSIASSVSKIGAAFGASGVSATDANVAYWSNGSTLTASDRQLVTGCLR